MAESKVARRYADALIAACDEKKNHGAIGKQLAAFAKVYQQSKELRSVFANPVVSADDKRAVMQALFIKFKFTQMMKNFLLVLLDHERLGELEGIARDFAQRMDAASGRLRATVTSAVALKPMERASIEKALKKLTGRDVVVEAKVDASLIGGVVTRIGNIVFDGSVKTDLDMLRESLLG